MRKATIFSGARVCESRIVVVFVVNHVNIEKRRRIIFLLIARVMEYDRDFILARSESSFKFFFTLHVVVATVALGDTPDGFAIYIRHLI